MRTLACSALLLLCAATAHASEPAATVAAAPPATSAAAADPNLDRGFLLPTAMTQPAGSITYNNYELFLHGLTYGVTDDVQVSATVLAPIIEDMPLVGMAALKARIYRGERVHLAVQGSLLGATNRNQASGEGGFHDSLFLGGVGALSSFCLRQDCSSLLSVSGTVEFNGDGAAVVYGGSLVHRVGAHVKLLAELASAGMNGSGFNDAALVSYGVRFYGSSIASDIGFIKPIGSAGDDGAFLMGLPFASISYRWQ